MFLPIYNGRKFGCRPSLPNPAVLAMQYQDSEEFLKLAPKLDPKHSLRSECSPIEDQGSHGSCVGHGTGGALELLELRALRELKGAAPEVFDRAKFNDVSRAFIYDCARLIDGTFPYDNGTSIHSAIKAISQSGICREKIWPYTDHALVTLPSATAYAEGLKHKVAQSYWIDNTKIAQIKQCLALGFPVVFGMTVFDSMMTDAVEQSGHIPYPTPADNSVGGHCMLIVGWDDTKGNGMFELRNSWGTGWGDQGYAWVDYEYLTNRHLAMDFWTIRLPS